MPEEQTVSHTPTPRTSSLGIPVAIVIAAALIAGAIVFSGMQNTKTGTAPTNPQAAQVTPEADIDPVTKDDHIKGNPNAAIMIVEYSDYDCVFCKKFHDTMDRIMDEYGAGGKVAWVYRHFPIASLHPNAAKLAEASECVAELGGNDAFWTFSDLVFGQRATNAPTDMTKLPDFATQSGVNKDAFNTCLTSNKYKSLIDADIQAAIATGAKGTPHSFLIAGNKQGVINGAQPYETVKQMVDTLIAQMGTTE